LTVYLYRNGFARFTHTRYANEDYTNTYVHLTNVAIQKNSEHYDAEIGGKWDIRHLKQYLISKYGRERVSECFTNIQSIFIKSLLAV
jgi:tubulin polyglutamylase TTLL9